MKPLSLAKSRLALGAEQRRTLALAFALDTIAALFGSPLVTAVFVVTADPDVRRCLQKTSVRLTDDDGPGLQSAVRAGCLAAASWRPSAGVAVVPADLPCLRADDVTNELASAQLADGAFVPDRATTATTMLMCPPGRMVVAQYGPGSAAKHQALGMRSLDKVPARARHDVDTLEGLRVAATLGLGPETVAALAARDCRGALNQHAS